MDVLSAHPGTGRRARGATVTMAALALLAACYAENAAPAAEIAVRDSAGVQIVENPSPELAAPYRLSAEPTLVLGGAGEVADPLFRVLGAVRLGDGGMVVANSGSSQLRYYAPDGSLIRSVGGKGGGPGEFQLLSWIALLPGDSVLAFDTMSRRYTVFDPAGNVARSFRTEGQAMTRPMGLTPNGTLLSYVSSLGSGPPPNGAIRDTLSVIRVASGDGSIRDTIARVAGDERILHVSPQAIEIRVPPFARRLVIATDGSDGYWSAGDDGYELAHYAADGRLDRLVRVQRPGRAATPEMLDALIARQLEGVDDPAVRQSREQGTRELPMPEFLPAVSRIVTARDGRVWAQDFVAPTDTVATWRVFDADGRYLGALTMPERFTVYGIGDDYVLGVLLDEDDVEEVRVYALVGA